MSMHDHDIVAGDPRPPRDQLGGDNNEPPLPDVGLPSPVEPHRVARFVFSAVGAFALGVFPGILLSWYVTLWAPPAHRIGTALVLPFLFAPVGSLCGIVLFRLLTKTRPSHTDLPIVTGTGLLFGLVGFLFPLGFVLFLVWHGV